MSFSKGEIDRIGNNIRNNSNNLKFEHVLELQQYRTEHQIPLSKVFNILCELTINNKKSTTIATYRLKRFESIINKLERFPKMRFSRMWDIGGCRIILENQAEVDIILEKIMNEERLEIKKINNHIDESSNDGYQSIHIYCCVKKEKLPIEIQIRTIDQHNWATLVEITDVIYKTRLKELGKESNEDFFNFHKHLSEKEALDEQKRFFIYKILKRQRFIENLNEIFSKNYINVRKQWHNIQMNTQQKYFLIEVDKNNKTTLTSFKKFADAEQAYFDLYNNTRDLNAVLTYQYYEDFKLLTTAYANYILTYHSFLKESLEILIQLVADSLHSKNYFRAYNIYNYINELFLKFIKTTITEIEHALEINASENNKFSRKRHLDWIKDITKQLKLIQSTIASLKTSMSKVTIDNTFYNLFFTAGISRIDKKYNNELKEVISNSDIFKDMLNV